MPAHRRPISLDQLRRRGGGVVKIRRRMRRFEKRCVSILADIPGSIDVDEAVQ